MFQSIPFPNYGQARGAGDPRRRSLTVLGRLAIRASAAGRAPAGHGLLRVRCELPEQEFKVGKREIFSRQSWKAVPMGFSHYTPSQYPGESGTIDQVYPR